MLESHFVLNVIFEKMEGGGGAGIDRTISFETKKKALESTIKIVRKTES